ncbi:hypothetical protein [Parashewanella tropica]|uniref:hypothetical protein n=1 Tax=Parashewanella tropica TaxID=2547970 RepID=UPI0010595BDC|nr:hypothetical protein [Parashewanella tropica]
MAKWEQIKKDNRSKNSGGVYPNPLQILYSLSLVFQQVIDNKLLVAWLYLWIRNQLDSVRCIEDIPDLIRIRSYEHCEKNAIRLYYDNSETSCEYAIEYQCQQQTFILWQPIPQLLNTLFCHVFRSIAYGSALLSHNQKQALLDVILKKQRRTTNLATVPLACKKVLSELFTGCFFVLRE